MAEPLHDARAHVLGGIELRLLRQKADTDAALRPRLAVEGVVEACHDPQERGLPGPLRPSTPILAPGKNERLMSRRMARLGGTILDTRLIV